MIILGVNHFFHDTSACLLIDGKLVAAVEEERFSGEKHTTDFPERAIEACLETAGLGYADIDHVALSARPWVGLPNKVAYAVSNPRGGLGFTRREISKMQRRHRALFAWMRRAWPSGKRPRLHFVEHHFAHVAGSFLVSPFEEAALLCLDGSGEWATSFLGVGRGRKVERFHQSLFPMSLGYFYESVTEFLGFRPNYDEGKTMGLAPYGDPSTFHGAVSDIARVDRNGGIVIDLSYFSHQFRGAVRCAPKFHQTFGHPRARDEELLDRHKDAAAAFQMVLEERALSICRMLRKQTGCRHLVLAGGVALNSVMNGRILREAGFDDIYVMPGAGDNGTSIGAAAYVYHCVLERRREHVHEDPYLGPPHGDFELEEAIAARGLTPRRQADIEATTARLLFEKKIVGWYQGRSEFGPRALGNRSILANPTSPHMKDTLNARVKHRESFRPFAPSALAERAHEYFDIAVEAPFMLKVCDVRRRHRLRLPAVTHVDGSARLQTVREDINPRFHRLIAEFSTLSGVPVVLNTSFNVMGQPILETPSQAIDCFLDNDIDALALGDYLLEKTNGRAH